jgi:hypothetical protein
MEVLNYFENSTMLLYGSELELTGNLMKQVMNTKKSLNKRIDLHE